MKKINIFNYKYYLEKLSIKGDYIDGRVIVGIWGKKSDYINLKESEKEEITELKDKYIIKKRGKYNERNI